MRAVQVNQPGGPEVMEFVDVDPQPPAAGEIRLRQTVIGLNFLDIYQRSGAYPLPLPTGIGTEAAGVVDAVGDGVDGLRPGDRVAYGAGPIGAYSQMRNLPAGRVAKVPDTIDDETAAAMMLKGMTVRYLLRETHRVSAGEYILLHAAAGGVGTIASQWAKALGAHVIGTVGSDEKAEIARAHGCEHVINYSRENVAERVREITGGDGVPVAYDGVGQATLEASLDSLAPRGILVSFGGASGPITGFNVSTLMAKGSLYLTRPSLMHYVAKDADLAANAAELMAIVEKGDVKIPINQRYGFSDVQRAHEDLASRKTTGVTILVADQ